MAWEFNSKTPIYLQIADEITMRIASGTYTPGEKLPAVRELALEAGVNPNTMQKALGYMEMNHLVYSERTSGRYVTKDQSVLGALRQDLIRRYTGEFVTKLKKIGAGREEIEAALEESLKEEKDGGC